MGGYTNGLYRASTITFIRQTDGIFLKNSIPSALLLAFRTLVEALNTKVMSLMCSNARAIHIYPLR